MGFQIRHATEDDIPGLLDIWRRFTRHLRSFDDRYDHADDAEDRWLNYFENQILGSKYGTVVIADEGGDIIGVAEARVRGGHPIFRLADHGYITGHYVRKGYRGEGVSPAILSEVHEWFLDNPRDITFYRIDTLEADGYVQGMVEESDFERIERIYEKRADE